MIQADGARGTREQLEHVLDVLADLLVGGEQAKVGVQPCGARMIVAGAQVRVAAQLELLALGAIQFAPHHQQHLGMALVANHAVDHMRAGGFEPLCPVDIGFLVKAR